MRRTLGTTRRAAFTLIELLAVIIILSVLSYFLIVNVTGAQETFEMEVTRSRALQIGGAIQIYEGDVGECPKSSLPAEIGVPPNNQNIGAECLYLALCKEKGAGFGKLDEHLSNTDGDALAKRPPGFEVPTLFELCDAWNNPYAYFSHKDYLREDQYLTESPETGEPITSVAKAIKNEKTGRFYEANGYQMISAGPDGMFGTEDDITSPFRVKKE